MLHAVGPAIDNYEGEEGKAYEVLQQTFSNVLQVARKEGCNSVAIHPISSGRKKYSLQSMKLYFNSFDF